MKLNAKVFGFFCIILALPGYAASWSSSHCQIVFEEPLQERLLKVNASSDSISEAELLSYIADKIDKVLEFQFIRDLGHKMGVRVWLFGGTASSFFHYAKWDLARSKGLLDLQKDRFDYDFTNIFRSTQDIDVVVDTDPQTALEFQQILAHRFPHFLGERSTSWEVRPLRYRIQEPGAIGYKEALLEDTDFQYQNTDSNSVGMIEITHSPGEPLVRDLRNWEQSSSIFLEDALQNRIRFLRSNRHFETSRARAGENPEILSVLRLLVKAFQYDLKLSSQDMAEVSKIAHNFQPDQVSNPTARRRIQDTAKKLVLHAVNIETAMNTLDQFGLRQKLISMGNKKEINSFAWWLNREPLRSKPVGQGQGATAKELGIQLVLHDTRSLSALESITRAHSGEPNVLISRDEVSGETALFGDGFYVTSRANYSSLGFPIRFSVDPQARQDSDFTIHPRQILRFHNKKALKIIPNSLVFELDDIIRLAESAGSIKISAMNINDGESIIFEKQLRRFTSAKIMAELEPLIVDHSDNSIKNAASNFNRIRRILKAIYHLNVYDLISGEVRSFVLKEVLQEVGKKSGSIPQEILTQYVKLIHELVNDPGSHGLIVTDQNQWIHLLVATRWNREIREVLFEGYVQESFRPFHALTDLVLNAQDISNSQSAVLIRELIRVHSLKDGTQSLSFEEISKFQRLLDGTDIEAQWFELFLHSFYPSSVFNSESSLGRMLVLCLYSPKPYLFNYGLRLSETSEFSNFAIVNAFRQIIALREVDSEFQDVEVAATYWMSSEGGSQELKTAFLLAHLGMPQYGKYWAALPQGQKMTVMKAMTQRSFMPIFHKWALEQEGSSVNPLLRKESFEFIPQVFQKSGRRVEHGNRDRNVFDGSWSDRPAHEVTFTKSFEVQMTPVTQFQWAWVMGENPSYFTEGGQDVLIDGRTIRMHPNRPVERVSWNDVQQFLKKLNSMDRDYDYRLPTEAEWEYSARGDTLTKFSFGETDEDLNLYAWSAHNSEGQTQDVASLRPNPFGLYDVHGNVWEWVQDWNSHRLLSTTLVNPRGPLFGQKRVVRGDAIDSFKTFGFRSTRRLVFEPKFFNNCLGFRLVRTPKPSLSKLLKLPVS